jgi:SsrA-binding protein
VPRSPPTPDRGLKPQADLPSALVSFSLRTREMTDQGVAASRAADRKLIASNKKARHDYAILKTYEAGIVLCGTEVKSLRAGRASLVDAFAQESNGEILLYGLHIAEYGYGTWTNHQPRRTRKLLLRRVEINKILDRIREPGLTLVPLSMYFENGWAKVEIGLARGKRSYDKRQALAERDANREIAREMGRHLKGMPRPD